VPVNYALNPNRSRRNAILAAALMTGIAAVPAWAQWNPSAGDWGKSNPNHIRVMTWNVRDNIVTTEQKTEGNNAWTALARILAAVQPDVLLLQETGDVGVSNGVDTPAELEQVVRLLFDGGEDPFRGGTVTSFVQKYAPGYSPQHVFASTVTDGFNRNIIVSVHPFADLNGAGGALSSNTVMFPADAYSPPGNAGIRGWGIAEIDLPDAIYAGDLVVGNSHLKSGGSSSDFEDRLAASQIITYTIDYLFNGNGTGTPDPNGTIFVDAATILDPNTPVIWGGDLNEDEDRNGRKGPAEWMTRAEFTGGSDGTDRDRTDSTFDDARDVFTNSRTTLGSNKLDYILWQDSIATEVRSFIFNSGTIPAASRPESLQNYSGASSASSRASDHRPVIVDFALPLAPPGCDADFNSDDSVNVIDVIDFILAWNDGLDFNGDGNVNVIDVVAFIAVWNAGCP
jgi:endonuclease/exonuclease/phosphatase family metal-dependent hydrolase